MKNNLLSLNAITAIAIILTFALVSCKKKDGSPATSSSGYYMRFKADGVKKEYTDSTWAKPEYGGVPPYHTGYFTGFTPDKTKNFFAFRVYDSLPIAANITYTEKIFPPTILASAYCHWSDENGKEYLSCKTSIDPIYPFSATITEMTATTVKGSFSGKAKETGGSTIITISDGEFYLPRR